MINFNLLGQERVRQLVVIGGAGLAIAPFLPWVKVVLLGSLDLFQYLQAGGHGTGLAWTAVGLGAAAAVVASRVEELRVVRILAIAIGGVVGLYAGFGLATLQHDVNQAHGFAKLSLGPWLAFSG